MVEDGIEPKFAVLEEDVFTSRPMRQLKDVKPDIH